VALRFGADGGACCRGSGKRKPRADELIPDAANPSATFVMPR